jgi:hypothetical protein
VLLIDSVRRDARGPAGALPVVPVLPMGSDMSAASDVGEGRVFSAGQGDPPWRDESGEGEVSGDNELEKRYAEIGVARLSRCCSCC